MKKLVVVLSLCVPVAFAGGYGLAIADAWDTCVAYLAPRPTDLAPTVCLDISSTGGGRAWEFAVLGVSIVLIVLVASLRPWRRKKEVGR